MNLLPQQRKKEREITPQQQKFLDLLFENGGQVTAAAVDAGTLAVLQAGYADIWQIVNAPKTCFL